MISVDDFHLYMHVFSYIFILNIVTKFSRNGRNAFGWRFTTSNRCSTNLNYNLHWNFKIIVSLYIVLELCL